MSKPILTEDKPWWYYGCVHRHHEVLLYSDGSLWGCCEVLEENEGLAVLYFHCLLVEHILVSREGLGSVCTTRAPGWYESMERPDFNRFIQGQMQTLKQSLG